MMKTLGRLAAIACAAWMLQGCQAVYSPVAGFIYLEVDYGGTATSADVGSKLGTSKAETYLGAVGRGDASINTAATSAGISRISHVDHKAFSILGIYGRYETYVYGD